MSQDGAYVVQPNDTLSGIAQRQLGRVDRWPEIANLNLIHDAAHLLIGQTLRLPPDARLQDSNLLPVRIQSTADHKPLHERPATIIPARAFFFVLADEMNPIARKAVRKVLLPPPGVVDQQLLDRLFHPQRHGFIPLAPESPVSMGRHATGRTDSRFISASNRTLGSPRFEGKRFWIDVAKAQRNGVRVHETGTIIADLDRVIAKTKDAARKQDFLRIREHILTVDHEILFEGRIPAAAVKTATQMAATRALQVVSGVGIVLTAYDLERAGERSVKQGSIKPLAAESVRQAGGWAGAWAGAELFAAAGVAVGIETGPGALVTGLVGGLIGGVVGFIDADWIARKIDAR